ncbi:MAG TPA: Lrp/AsnC family transcriptional regulator [Stellaceae bacterium]|nr:Lrp/AsnC family transcriptional regulator [Stellaceae bacterium]
MTTLDLFDLRLLAALQEDGRLTNAELAERTLLSPSQCARRVQRLRETGFIERFVAVLDAQKLGIGVRAYVSVVMRSHGEAETRAFRDRLLRLPEVQECCKLTGDSDYLLKIATRDLADYNRILTEYLLKSPDIATVRSGIMLEEVKSTTALPLPGA